MAIRMTTTRTMTITMTAIMTRVSQLWDLIENWGFREDIQGINNKDDENKDNKDLDDNNEKDDNNNNNRYNNNHYNNKDDKNDKGISAVRLDRDVVFLREHQGHLEH